MFWKIASRLDGFLNTLLNSSLHTFFFLTDYVEHWVHHENQPDGQFKRRLWAALYCAFVFNIKADELPASAASFAPIRNDS